MEKEELEKELTGIQHELKSMKDKFGLFTSVVLFVLTLQVVGSVYTSISIKDSTNEFIDLKTEQFNQIIANEKLDPNLKVEHVDVLKANVNKEEDNKFTVTFSVGINNIGSTPATGFAVKVLLPDGIETEYQSFEDSNYKYEILAMPEREGMFVPPDSVFRQRVEIPVTSGSIQNMKHGSEVKVKVLLYSKFGLEDERVVVLRVRNLFVRYE